MLNIDYIDSMKREFSAYSWSFGANFPLSNYSGQYERNLARYAPKDKLFRGTWLEFDDWVKAVKKSVLEVKRPQEILPLRAVNVLSKSFTRKLPSWSSRKWKSLT